MDCVRTVQGKVTCGLVYPMDTAWLTGRESPGRSLERTESTVPLPPAPVKPEQKPEPENKSAGGELESRQEQESS